MEMLAFCSWLLCAECVTKAGRKLERDSLSNLASVATKEMSQQEGKNAILECPIQPVAEALREAQAANKDLQRSVNELTAIRVQLEGERDSLAAELADTRDALKEAQARLDAANAALSQLRSEMDHRLREKDEEIDAIRYDHCSRPKKILPSLTFHS